MLAASLAAVKKSTCRSARSAAHLPVAGAAVEEGALPPLAAEPFHLAVPDDDPVVALCRLLGDEAPGHVLEDQLRPALEGVPPAAAARRPEATHRARRQGDVVAHARQDGAARGGSIRQPRATAGDPRAALA